MNRLASKRNGAQLRANRVRSVIRGSKIRPRLSVHVSNYNISAQLIDDDSSITMGSVTTVGQKIKGNMTDKADWAGHQIGLKAKKLGVKNVVFDRGSKQYHGRVKQVADSARSEGLEF